MAAVGNFRHFILAQRQSLFEKRPFAVCPYSSCCCSDCALSTNERTGLFVAPPFRIWNTLPKKWGCVGQIFDTIHNFWNANKWVPNWFGLLVRTRLNWSFMRRNEVWYLWYLTKKQLLIKNGRSTQENAKKKMRGEGLDGARPASQGTSQATHQCRNCKTFNDDEYPSGSINTQGMQPGTFLRKHHHYNGRHPLSRPLFFALILILPSLLHSIILWNPCLFFLSGLKPRFCLLSLALWPARHPFSPLASSLLLPLSHSRSCKELSHLLYQLIFFHPHPLCGAAVHFLAEECMFVVNSPIETLWTSDKCIVVWISIKAALLDSFPLWMASSESVPSDLQYQLNHPNKMNEMAFHCILSGQRVHHLWWVTLTIQTWYWVV